MFRPVRFGKRLKYICLVLVLFMSACATQRAPTLIPFDDGEFWVLGNDLIFTIRDTGEKIIVPRGFVTDFASVPRIFWTFFPKHGEYTRAAIVHDFLYWEQKCSREQADELFDIVMADSEVDSTTRFSIYTAVRVWGDDAWEENARARQDGDIRIIPERYMHFPVKTRWENYRGFLRQMGEESEWRARSTIGTPVYCHILKDKEQPAVDTTPPPSVVPSPEPPATGPDDRPVPAPQPELTPNQGSSIGA